MFEHGMASMFEQDRTATVSTVGTAGTRGYAAMTARE